jgi:3',5'-cyclic AMP phosphodiesterase CpdA
VADTPIWDMRCGDAGDNRTSPYGRGMLRLALSAALDFNILKAAVVFLALVIGPALLVGLAPTAAFYLGRLNIRVAVLGRTYPLPVLVLLAFLAAAAFWVGRPLLSRAIDHFWNLHYTLVFPIFVTLRETLRIAAERFPTRAVTPQQLHRRRRAGSVLAALLLAAAGALLAWRVEVSTGLRLIDAGQVRPWTAVMAALGNAAVILGLSTVIESVYWLQRELTLGPVLDWAPAPAAADLTRVRVAHLSDLHVVGERYGYRMESGTLGPQGNQRIRAALHQLSAMQGSAPIDRILVTGDVTDAGTRAEWAELIDLLEDYPEVRARLSFVPGNHDVNIVDRLHPALLDLPWSTDQALRKLRVVLALEEFQGDRAHVVDRATGEPGPSLRDYLQQGSRPELLRNLAKSGSAAGRREMLKTWQAIFPLVEPAGDNDYGVILLNSNARSHFSLTNAIGVIDRPQLAALRAILRNSSTQAWLILLHHQIVEYPLTSISLRDRIGLALINAPDVLAAIGPHARRILVMHGHRHRDWIGACGDVVLCSAPSVALGSYGSETDRGSFHIHELAIGAGGELRLMTTERVQVA